MKSPLSVSLAAILAFSALPRQAAALTDATWLGGNGNWSNSALWSPTTVPNGALYNVLLDNSNALNSIVDLDMWATIGGLTIDSGDMLRINNGQLLNLSNATVNNAGTLLLNSSGSATYLWITGATSFTGTGKITLGGSGNNYVTYGASPSIDTLTLAQTLEGRGELDVILNNQAAGLVDANATGGTLTLKRTVTNAGTLRASNGGTLSLNSIAVANSGGVITSTSGGIVNLNTSTINGGTLTNSGGTLNLGNSHLNGTVGGGVTVNGTVSIGNGTISVVSGTIQNNGVINFAAQGSTSYLFINGAVNLQGSGSITMGGQGPNQIRYNSNSSTDTLNSYQTIQGAGAIAVNLNNTTGQLVDANINGTTLGLYTPTTNAGTLRASNGGTLSLINIAVENTGGTIFAQTGSTVNLNNSTINGGTVTNSDGTVNSGSAHLNGAVGGGVTLNGALTLQNGVQPRISGTIQNNGVINFAAQGSTTYLLINGTVNLQGSGNVTMGGQGPNQIRYYSSGSTDTLNSYQTIQGAGAIAVNFNNTTGQLVDANINGATLGIFAPTTNSGTLRASNGGTLSINNQVVTNTGGTILAQTGSTVNLNSSTINGGTLTNSGGTLNAGSTTVLNGTVGGGITLNGTMDIGNGMQPRVSGTIQNNGVINFAAQGSTTYLLISGAVNLQGSGSITMGGQGPNQIQYLGNPVTDVLNNAQTIQGKGTLAVRLNNLTGGIVDGNISGQTLTIGANLTNTGTLRASGGGALTITTTTVTNIGGLIQAQTGSTVNFASGAVINGGTVQNSGGTFNFGSVTLDGTDSAGITLQGTFGAPTSSTVTLMNTIHNQGSISLNSTSTTTTLNVGGNGTGVATLLDGGTITLGATGTGSVLSASSTGNRLINENNTIQGQGILGNGQAKLTNRGVIDANVSGGTLVLNPRVADGAAFNAGTIRASNGGTLSIQTAITNYEGATNGIIEATEGATLRVDGASVTGGTVRTVGAGQIKLASATVTGGSLLNSSTGIIRVEGGTSTVNGLNNAAGGQVIIDHAAVLNLQNTVQNDGTILINPTGSETYLFADGSVTLQGAGKVTMGGSGNNTIRYNSSGSTDTLTSYQTIEGSGTIGVLFNNQTGGMVDANVTAATLGISATTTNAGTLRASNGGTLSLNNITVSNIGGTILAQTSSTVNLNSSAINGGTLTNSGGTLNTGFGTHLNGSVGGGITLNGTMSIGNGQQPVVSGTMQNNGVINFAAQGSTTYLLINGAVTLQGSGNITMGGQGPNQIRYNGDPVNDSLTNAQIIQGAGAIGVNLTNQSTGVVDAYIGGQTLSLLNNITNTGILQASGGGTLSTSPAFVTNIGGTIQALTGSTVNFNSGTRIDGGLVRNTGGTMTFGSGATFDGTDTAGITLQGAMSVPNGVILTLLNTVHNQGTLSITPSGSSTYIRAGGNGTGTVTLDGGGTISLTTSSAILDATNIGNRLVNVDNTISGQGSVGVANMKLTNSGLIHANVDGGTLTVMPQAIAGGGVNDGTMRASGGGLLTIQNTIQNVAGTIETLAGSRVNVTSGTIQQSFGGVTQAIGASEIRLSSGQILGGSLLNSSTGIIRSASGTSRINTLTNPVGGQVIVDNATTLALQGTLTNNGTIAVNGAGSATSINIEGTVTLLGTGSVTLGSSSGGTISWGSNVLTDVLVNPQQTIQGKGAIDVSLTNQAGGIVQANVSGQTLGMNRNVTNTGLLLGAGGATLSLNNITVNNAGGLILSNTNGVVNLNASTIIGGTVSSSGTGGVFSGSATVLDGATAGSLTTTGNYKIYTGAATIVKGTINNTGTITMNGNGSTAYLLIDGVVSLEGSSGKVVMGVAGPNQIRYNTSGATDTLNSHQTIEGAGVIGVNFNNTAGNLVDANITGQTLGISGPTINGTGSVIQASNGGTLSLNSIAVTNIGATIRAQAGSTVLMNSSTIYGGLINNVGGSIQSGSATFLDGSVSNNLTMKGTYTLGNGAATAIKGTINNDGVINFASSGSTAYLLIDGVVNLQSSNPSLPGKVTMGGTGPNQIRYNSSGSTDTLNSYQTIEGAGVIGVNFNNTAGNLVDANIPGQTLGISAPTINGTGSVIQASNSGTLSLNNIAVTNIGATIQAAFAGATVLMNNSTIYGGLINNVLGSIQSGSGTFLDGSVSGNLTIQGTYTLDNGDTTALRGTINNSGNINYDASGSPTYLLIDGTVNLRGSAASPGSGVVTMEGAGGNFIRYNGSPTGDGLNNYQTIQGKGTIDVIMENKATGVVNASVLGQTLNIQRDLTNAGVLRAENGGMLSVNGITASTGEINSLAGSQVSFNSPSVLLDQGTTITGPAQTRLISGTTFIGDSAADTIPTSNFLVAGGTLTGPGKMNVSDSFTLTAGTVTGTGDLNLLSGSNNTINGASNTIDGRDVNNQFGATLTMVVDSLTLRGGTYISNDGTLNVQGNTTVNGIANGGGTIINSGTMIKTGSGTATFNGTLDNSSTVEVQSGRLILNGTSYNSGAYVVNNDLDFAYLDFGSGTHNFNAGTSITGTGQARINGGGTVNVNATTHVDDIALVSGVIQGAGALTVDRNMYWSAGTMYGSGQANISSAATMYLATADTKYLHGRDLVNYGTVNWSGGTIHAADGASFYNMGGANLGITGNVTFTRADEDSDFINNGNLAVPAGSSLTINSDFTNNGRVEQGSSSLTSVNSLAGASAAGGTVTVNGNIKGNGVWDAIGSFLNWVTGGIFANKTVSGTTNVTAGGQLSIQGPGVTTISGSGSGIVAGGGGNIVAGGGGNIVAAGGGNIVAGGGGNIVAAGGGNIVAAGGGNIVAAGGGNVAANGGSGIVAAGGGNVRATGAGSGIVAAGGGNIVAAGGGNIVAAGGGNIVAAGGGNIVAAGGGNIVAAGGGNIVAGGGLNFTGGETDTISSIGSASLADASFTGPIILAEDGGNLIGETGGTFTGNVVAQSGGSLLPGNANAVGTMTITGGLDLQTGSLLKMDLNALGQGTGYDFLTISDTATFNGNLILNLGYAIRTLAGTDTLTVLTAASPVTGTIGNLTGNRVADADGLGSFRVTYGTTNSVVLDDFQASALTFNVWKGAWNFAATEDATFDADPDLDGVPNGMEYGLGMDPLKSDAHFLPQVSVINVSGVNYLALTYVRQAGVNLPTDLSFAVERSADLSAPGGGWSTAGVVQQSVTAGPGTGFETVVMRSATPAGSGLEFLRLKVTKP